MIDPNDKELNEQLYFMADGARKAVAGDLSIVIVSELAQDGKNRATAAGVCGDPSLRTSNDFHMTVIETIQKVLSGLMDQLTDGGVKVVYKLPDGTILEPDGPSIQQLSSRGPSN